ncbi:DUF4376 domain-containing protein [Pseudaminobacter sp. 19-2017]|uniref:DUF4376 domain-containing protein n=1 Tax=Pseudaminobacter soli (ex Zhang et al. 2022) TaxID=2831468 RepID=A0A942DWR6_9HYPH|nr:DUF4376 domain-containing protein [Pseudaminobacter soli]MBS3648616.1 DUF4376 domain-containing protein [Pseudaminobacter soli]
MPLFKEVEGQFLQWVGEPVGDVRHPMNIEEFWSDEDLEAIGLYRPVEPDPIPAGKVATLTHPARVNGVVKYVHTLVDATVTSEEVNAEALRRIEQGFRFNGKMFDNDTLSNRRISGAGTLALAAITQGKLPGDYHWHLTQAEIDAGGLPFSWIVKDNTTMLLDCHQVFELGQAAAAWEKAHVFAARALKDMGPVPLDYRDDKHWPSV